MPTSIYVPFHHNLYPCVFVWGTLPCSCLDFLPHAQVAQEGKPSGFNTQTLLNFLRSMTSHLGWLDYVRKHHRGLIVGKPRLWRITIYFAPPQFSFPEAVFVYMCQSTGRVDDGDEAWGWEKGAMCARGGRWMMLQTPEPDGTEPLSSLVTVIMQSKLPSMMYGHVVVCVSHACL